MTTPQGWRVGHHGRDQMFYEERVQGTWQRLAIDGEMLLGPAHHVIYFASPEQWLQYPEWARHRRAEIISRIMSEFRRPDYEYDGVTVPPFTPSGSRAQEPDAPPRPQPPSPPASGAWRATPGAAAGATAQQLRALRFAIVIVLSIAAGMGWLVIRGVTTGTTNLPAKRPSQMRAVMRVQEPAMYWVAIGVYAALGVTTLGLGLWGARQWITLQRSSA